MDILQSIMAERRGDVASASQVTPVEVLAGEAARRTHHSLTAALTSDGTSIIAEMKKASPSAGVLRDEYIPADIALMYRDNGACAVSVLTEPRHFGGDEQHLRAVRGAVDIPVLRKDFICDAYQICEAAAWGADVVLLIVAALEPERLRELHDEAKRLGLDVLAEAHTGEELDAALGLEGAIIGVNSRDLKTLKTDLAVARDLAGRIPSDRLSVAESGIRTRDDIEALEQLGYNGFLVGETLMRARDPGAALRGLLGVA